MPGLLDTDDFQNFTAKFWVACFAEFLGTFLFAFFGGAAPGASAAVANGIALAVLVYVCANVSGGHLNPAVTVATMVTGDTSAAKGGAYIVSQIAGSVIASLMHWALIPGAADVGCFHAPTLSGMQLFGWEAIMTFLLVATVYSVAVGEPSFGIIGPLAIGLSLFAAAITGGGFTGASLNPARALGPSIVWGCYWDQSWIYILAELFGAVAAGLLSGPLYGWGPNFGAIFGNSRPAAGDGSSYQSLADN